MKLLFDQQLSPRLVNLLSPLFPGSSHVHDLGLGRATDDEIWQYARDNAFILVSREADLSDISALKGFPPKLIWIRIGNCTITQIESLLRSHSEEIEQMNNDPQVGILSLF